MAKEKDMDGSSQRIDISDGLTDDSLIKLRACLYGWFESGGMDSQLRGVLWAVVEELAGTIMEHSDADWMEIGVAWFDDGLMVSITDNGAEFDPTQKAREKDYEAYMGEDMNRSLGLFMARQLTKTFSYLRDEEGLNRVVMEIPNNIGKSAE